MSFGNTAVHQKDTQLKEDAADKVSYNDVSNVYFQVLYAVH